MALNLTVKNAKQALNSIKLESGQHYSVINGDSINLAGRADIHIIRKGKHIVIQTANGEEYVLDNFYMDDKAIADINSQTLTWDDAQGQLIKVTSASNAVTEGTLLAANETATTTDASAGAATTTKTGGTGGTGGTGDMAWAGLIGLGAIGVAAAGAGGGGGAPTQSVGSGTPIDTSAPTLTLTSDNRVAQTVTMTFSENLDATHLPAASTFTVSVNGAAAVAANSVAIGGANQLIVTFPGATFTTGDTIAVTYTDPTTGSNDIAALQDAAGNDVATFTTTSFSVLDGYVRGAAIYIDVNGNGVAETSENTGVVTDANGNFFLPVGHPTGSIIAVGGFNIDTGVANTIELKAPAGATIITPLTTLVQAYIAANAGTTQAAAETAVQTALGITADVNLLTFDPLAKDVNATDALAVQKVAASVATLIALAGTDNTKEASVLQNFVAEIKTANTNNTSIDLTNNDAVTALVAGTGTTVTTITNATNTISNATTFAGISDAQSTALDTVAPATPTLLALTTASDTGVSGDSMTNSLTPTIRVSLNMTATDGTAVVAGNTINLYNAANTVVAEHIVTATDFANGYADVLVTTPLTVDANTLQAEVIDGVTRTSGKSTATIFTVDNVAPAITSAASASYAENAITTVYTAAATDTHTPLTYALGTGGDNSLFNISATGEVTFITAPNYEAATDAETNNVYDITVNVTDAAGNTASQAVAVTVTNLNDTSPVFTSGSTGTVAENALISTSIYSAVTTDADNLAARTYTLGGTDAGLLDITSDGIVTLNASANFENKASYSFNVIANDGLNTSTQAVVVSVTDVNEAPTAVVLNNTVTSIAENITVGAGIKVADIAITDDALGTNVLSLSGTDAGSFSIVGSALYYTGSSPNYESKTSYAVTVNVNDATVGNTPDASQSFTLTVTDVNEAPVFTAGATAGPSNFAENTSASTVVYTAAATDVDAATTLTYTLGGADAGLFNVSSSGQVTFKASPNFEVATDAGTDNIYNITVTASDGALSASQSAAITVTDVNEAPVFTAGATAAPSSFAENTSASTVVYTATATDVDAATTLTYTLGGADAGLFNVSASGQVTFKASPNFEVAADAGTDNIYNITVTATDNGTGLLSASQSAVITVTNVNEAPTSVGPIPTAIAINGQLYTLDVHSYFTDPDTTAPNNTLKYTASGLPNGLSIDASTGIITGTATADAAPTSVTITATDLNGANGGLQTTQTFTLGVVSAPAVQSFTVVDGIASTSIGKAGDALTFSVAFTEAVTVANGSPIITFSANGQTVTATYSGGTGSNTLTFTGTAPIGNGTSISLTSIDLNGATVTGNVTNQAWATSSVGQTYAGYTLDNTAPAVTASYNSNENTLLDTTPHTVTLTATDANAVIWSGLTGADAAKFSLASNGTLTFAGVTNFEAKDDAGADGAYNISVTATDAAGNVTTQALAINLQDVNEVPVFTAGATAAPSSFAENTSASTVVYTAAATDVDAATTLTYTLGGADAGLFNVSASGQVAFKTSPNFENKLDVGADNVYNIIVTASDGVLSTTQSAAITVTNVNEAPTLAPTWTGGNATITAVNGQALPGGTGFANDFVDPDAGDTLTYSIVSGTLIPGITLNSNGSISGTPTTDGVYSFTLRVTDANGLHIDQPYTGTIVTAPALTSMIDAAGNGATAAVTNFDVTSNIVFSATETVTAVAGRFIHIINDGGTGFHGEALLNTQNIDVASSMVTISGTGSSTKITVNPGFDLDLANNYHITVDAGAFLGSSSGIGSLAINNATDFNFSTVTPGTHQAGTAATEAVASQTMNANGIFIAGMNWLDVQQIGNDTGSVTQLGDLSIATDTTLGNGTNAYALVFKNYATVPGGPAPIGDTTDGVSTFDTNVGVINFGINDLLYIDGQTNDPTLQVFNAAYTGTVDGFNIGGILGQTALTFGTVAAPQQTGSNAVVMLGFEGNVTNTIYPDILSAAQDWHTASAPVIMG